MGNGVVDEDEFAQNADYRHESFGQQQPAGKWDDEEEDDWDTQQKPESGEYFGASMCTHIQLSCSVLYVCSLELQLSWCVHVCVCICVCMHAGVCREQRTDVLATCAF